MVFVVITIFILAFGTMGGLAYWKIKQTDPNNIDTSNKAKLDTAQDFLIFDDIKDSVIHLGCHQYRAIIKCNSTNFDLKTEKEQDIIELSFQRFLNSLSHPISFFIQTRTMDNTNMMKGLKDDILKSIEEFPVLVEYGDAYYNDMSDIYNEIGNNKEKNKYIIVPFNDAISLTNSSEQEKYEYSIKEIQNRCQIIIDGLQSVGLKAKILNTKELADLVYSSYHKDNASQIENIINGEFLSMMVEGEDKLSNVTDEGRLDWILYEAQLRLETELANEKAINPTVKNKSIEAINKISSLRDTIAGFYKTEIETEVPKLFECDTKKKKEAN